MNAYVAVTDPDWFRFLATAEDADEVNFWYPKPWGGEFRVLSDGQPLLFKLKSPYNAIAGGGFFKHYTELPLSRAWQSFGRKNGAATYEEVWRRITRLRRETPRPWDDPAIGCVLLVEPFFWPEELWIRELPGWQHNIQRGRTYDLRESDGKRIWQLVVERLNARPLKRGSGSEGGDRVDAPGGYADPMLQARRLGQGTFQVMVVDAYGRRCAVTGERALPALDAAHIRPFRATQEHKISNGILLRSDVHRLFDAGYVTITPAYRVAASPRMRKDFNDGENYLRLDGTEVSVPAQERQRPDREALQWHNDSVFRG